MDKEAIIAEKLSILNGKAYKRIPYIHHRDILEEYAQAAGAIANVLDPDGSLPIDRRDIPKEKEPLFRSLMSDVTHASEGDLVGHVKLKVKTHKESGAVVCRQLHASTRHPMKPGMRWIAKILRQKLDSLPHLAKNTDAVINTLKSTYVYPDDRLLKIDVKDFLCQEYIPTSSANHPVSSRLRRPMHTQACYA